MSIKDFETQKKLADLVIMPEIKDLQATDFDNVDMIVQRGYKAALPYRDYFMKLADSLDKYGVQNPIENILDKQYYSFDRIEINGNNIYSDRQVLDVLDIKPGRQADKYQLTNRIELLYGKAWFEKVKYRIVPRNDSLVLCIDCVERPKVMLYGSVHYDDPLSAGIVLKLSAKNLLTLGSVIDLDSYLGKYFRGRATYLQYIDRNQKFGLSAEVYTDNTLIPLLDIWEGETGRVISRNFTGGLNINRRLGLNNIMNISADYENLYLVPEFVTEADLKNISYKYLTATYNYMINTLDSKHYPDRGTILNLSAGTSKLLSATVRTESAETDYDRVSPGEFAFNRFFILTGNFKRYFTAGRWTFSVGGDALYISDGDSLLRHNNFFLLGGIESVNRRSIPMNGFHTNEIPVGKLAGIGTELDMELFKDFHLNIMVNAFAVQEVDREDGYSLLAGYGIGVGYMSIIGPLKAGLMLGQYSREEYFKKIKSYLSVGFNF